MEFTVIKVNKRCERMAKEDIWQNNIANQTKEWQVNTVYSRAKIYAVVEDFHKNLYDSKLESSIEAEDRNKNDQSKLWRTTNREKPKMLKCGHRSLIKKTNDTFQ